MRRLIKPKENAKRWGLPRSVISQELKERAEFYADRAQGLLDRAETILMADDKEVSPNEVQHAAECRELAKELRLQITFLRSLELLEEETEE